jgi:S-adenosylmethionine hydrolase
MASFTASGVITITTDFGHQGPFVGVMKGRMLSRYPAARIIDLTHEILVHWPAEAGFWLMRSFAYFPLGTVHIAVVDPGVGTARNIIAVTVQGHIMLAPDNGLLAPLITRFRDAAIVRIEPGRLPAFGITRTSATFHGRDIFAPLAAELAAGRCLPADLGTATRELIPAWVDEPEVSPGRVQGVVITLDHFGNLISNIDAALVAGMREPEVRVGNHTFALRKTYGDVQPGDYLALINSFEVIEIARAEQSAADGLGCGRGAPVIVQDRSFGRPS